MSPFCQRRKVENVQKSQNLVNVVCEGQEGQEAKKS